MEKEKQAFYNFWDNNGELFASMANGNIKQFAKDVWDSALTVKDIEELEETTNRDKQLYTQKVVDSLKEEIAALKAEIERKDEAIVKAKLEIEKHRTFTNQGWIQEHIANAYALKIHRTLEQALKDGEYD